MLEQGKNTAEFLVSEAPGTQSRDTVTVTVPASTTLNPGTVLGKIAASGKYVPYDDAASDGREDAAGILYGALVNDTLAGADYDGVVINWSAEVREADLEFGAGVDEDKAAADLGALGIKLRTA
jgi:Bacteriophage lambda head decoration protein D